MHMVVEALVHMQWSWCKAFCANSTLLHTLAHCCRLVQIFAQAVVQETKYTGAGLHTCECSVQPGVAPVLLLPCPLFALLQSSFTAEAAPSKIQMCQMWNSWQLTKIKLWAQSRSRSVNQSLFEKHFLCIVWHLETTANGQKMAFSMIVSWSWSHSPKLTAINPVQCSIYRPQGFVFGPRVALKS